MENHLEKKKTQRNWKKQKSKKLQNSMNRYGFLSGLEFFSSLRKCFSTRAFSFFSKASLWFLGTKCFLQDNDCASALTYCVQAISVRFPLIFCSEYNFGTLKFNSIWLRIECLFLFGLADASHVAMRAD